MQGGANGESDLVTEKGNSFQNKSQHFLTALLDIPQLFDTAAGGLS